MAFPSDLIAEKVDLQLSADDRFEIRYRAEVSQIIDTLLQLFGLGSYRLSRLFVPHIASDPLHARLDSMDTRPDVLADRRAQARTKSFLLA